ncbi:unnamed protein product [Rotaria sp. Silwood1]|nr:unnamed protein product [Rotaria sp. Silwood1]CAF1136530.1 unnamed protein product [Rotaria sp. Silwood1]CAF3453327.1 unnamed protein product [Rotaria sp. Silwood1]CAF4757701.1 unnamed protein product [Rotaria sp. Silwood1]
MRSIKLSTYLRRLLYTLLLGSLVSIYINFNRSTSNIKNDPSLEVNNISLCLPWQSINHQPLGTNSCLPYKRIISSVWTHDGTGIMKYIQWIVTRKLGNVRILRLNDECELIQENNFFFDSKNDRFVQIYIVSLTMNFNNTSICSTNLVQIIQFGLQKINQIYFKRRSIEATVAYHHLDQIRQNHNFTFNWNVSFNINIQKARFVTEHLINYFKNELNTKSTIINSEEMIHSNLNDTEKKLSDFISLLGFNTSTQTFKDILQYDCYQFVQDATWWDQSETIEHILSTSLNPNLATMDKSNDFYHLHGNYSFSKYVSDSRQCFNDGTFFQMQCETIPNRFSTDKPERCSLKKFDCAFSDIYSFSDREQLYQSYAPNNYFNTNPIKCGFAIQSILDTVRNRYERNDKCQIIVFTCITNCYDALPIIQDRVPPGTCFVALLDTKTMDAFKRQHPAGAYPMNGQAQWDFIDLGQGGSLFRVAAKVTETVKMLGHRMFPMAKWFVWLDGKAFIININEILSIATTPIIGLHHHDFNRTSEAEVNLTIARVILREINNVVQLNNTLQEIELQQAEYKRDGFYSRSNAIGLPMFDIAIFIYRNNHPCSFRYLCGWHNEINYFSYRGQLSVYYSAERLNLSSYLGFIPRRLYHTLGHRTVC